MFGIGIQELIVILLIILLLFGSKKLPELSRSIGQSLKEIREGFNATPDENKDKDKKSKSHKSA